jgi:hypothetical protein
MSTTTPTEAHIALVRGMAAQGYYLGSTIEHYAQLIADSESRAVAKQVEALAILTLRWDELEKERDQLRAEFEKLAITTAQAQDRNVSYRLERDKAEAERTDAIYQRACEVERELRAEVKRMTHAYEYDHKCLCEVQDRCELWKQRAEKAEADLAKYLSACPASPTEEERKRCQQWWSISGRAS